MQENEIAKQFNDIGIVGETTADIVCAAITQLLRHRNALQSNNCLVGKLINIDADGNITIAVEKSTLAHFQSNLMYKAVTVILGNVQNMGLDYETQPRHYV